MQSGKFIDLFEVCKCGMLCVNYYSIIAYNYEAMQFWPLLLQQRLKFVFSFHLMSLTGNLKMHFRFGAKILSQLQI